MVTSVSEAALVRTLTPVADVPASGPRELDSADATGIAVDKSRASRIMMVDDDESVLEVVSLFLEEDGYVDVLTSSDPVGATSLVEAEDPDLLLLDVQMPQVSGIDILSALRRTARFEHLPIIILTAASDPATKLEVLNLGATDFLAKPVDPSELLLRVRNTLAAKAHRDSLAFHDEATGLANRTRLLFDADRLQQRARANEAGLAVLTVSVQGLERSAQMLGDADSCSLMSTIARRLELALSDGNTGRYDASEWRAYRVAGEAFTVVSTQHVDASYASALAERMVHSLERPIVVGGADLSLAISVGIALEPDDGATVSVLLERAALAAANAGRVDGKYMFYSAQLHEKLRSRLALQGDLRKAVEHGELELWYQPKISAADRGLSSFEALARWRHPERGLVPPDVFIPMVEQMGLAMPMGQWVLESACRACAGWNAFLDKPVGVAVNVSAHQIKPAALTRAAYGAIVGAPLTPNMLTLELTESVFLGNAQEALSVLESVRGLGVSLSLDDFGTGYSSFSYLTQMPIDELKIDRSFVQAMASGPRSVAIVRGIVAMAHALGLSVVAEGVETEAEADTLGAAGCDVLQGYLFSKPLEPSAIHRYLMQLRSAANA